MKNSITGRVLLLLTPLLTPIKNLNLQPRLQLGTQKTDQDQLNLARYFNMYTHPLDVSKCTYLRNKFSSALDVLDRTYQSSKLVQILICNQTKQTGKTEKVMCYCIRLPDPYSESCTNKKGDKLAPHAPITYPNKEVRPIISSKC